MTKALGERKFVIQIEKIKKQIPFNSFCLQFDD